MDRRGFPGMENDNGGDGWARWDEADEPVSSSMGEPDKGRLRGESESARAADLGSGSGSCWMMSRELARASRRLSMDDRLGLSCSNGDGLSVARSTTMAASATTGISAGTDIGGGRFGRKGEWTGSCWL